MENGSHSGRLAEFAEALCQAENYKSLLSTIVTEICRFLEAENLLLWIHESKQNELTCEASRLTTLNRSLAREVCPADAGILSQMLTEEQPRQFSNFKATRHLSIIEGSVLRSAMFAPMRSRTRAIGVLEVINKREGAFTDDDLAFFGDCARLVSTAVAAWRAHESMSGGMMEAVTRLTLLFDVTQSFSSTIALDELAPIICSRTANVLEAGGCSLWLVRQSDMVCRSASGPYRQDVVGQSEIATGTVIGDMVRSNAPLVLNDPSDQRVVRRLQQLETGPIRGIVCVPIKYEDKWLGALEVINRNEGGGFSDSDSVLLMEVAEQAAKALRNAQRHEAERKVKELQALLLTSREITSTLDLDRMLAVVVNQVATLIPFDRCAIALLNKGRYQISSIAGESVVKSKDSQVKAWNEIIDWAAQTSSAIYVSLQNGEVNADRQETREKFLAHFKTSGMSSFYSLPLKDEEGPLGVLALESQTPQFLSDAHLELLNIFAGLATVALRNAQLYRQVPLIGALQPLAAKKRAFQAMPKARRLAAVAASVVVVLLLLFFPWNLKVGGSAYVLPTRTAQINAEVDGIIAKVNYREGDVAPAGAVVATLRTDEHLLNLNEAQMRFDIISRELTRVQAAFGPAAAQIERVKLDQTGREIALYRAKVEQTQIRAPLDGVIITPRIEEKVGRYIRRGEVLCETAQTSPIVIETAVAENDIGLVNEGQEVWLKANAFPERKFKGRVTRVSPQARIEQGERVFIAHAEIDNPDRALRAGMVGRAKILTGERSLGLVLLRDPSSWLRKKLWQWMP